MRTTARRPSILAAVLGALLLVAACAPDAPRTTDAPPATGGSSAAWLSDHGLDGMSGREVVDHLEAMPVAERPTDLVASIKPDSVELSDVDGNTTSLDLPEDEFYVSVAPYIAQTHDCFFHSLTTCLGELRDQGVSVQVVDGSGAVLVDQDVRTADNGFVGLWLPRGVEATLTIEHDGRAVAIPVSTGDDDPTCVTTARLA